MKAPKKWKNGPPELDWDDKLNKLKGQKFTGLDFSGDASSVTLRFGARAFHLSGDGQKHTYGAKPVVVGVLDRIECVGCRAINLNGITQATYTSRFHLDSGHFDLVVSRVNPSTEGFRFKLKPGVGPVEPAKTGEKPVLAFRVG